MKSRKLLSKLLRNSKHNFSFEDAIKIARMFGFQICRVQGSHHILRHSGIPELLNFQNVHGKAKPYQLKQLLSLIEMYNLVLEEKE